MQPVKDIRTLHLELTDKCQAQCPMCARNFHGGATRSFIRNGDISLDVFKAWFPPSFLSQLDNVYSCGNYGDPAFVRDCLEIFGYIRECNPTVRLAIHTNGGMRSTEWWAKLANVLGTQSNSEVVFAVDGFAGKHELYRRNTKFEKVIENMVAYVQAGGTAKVDSLVFEHNEHETKELETYLYDRGVSQVNFVSTKRFYEMSEFEVQNLDGSHAYSIKPAQLPEFKQTPNKEIDKLLDNDFRRNVAAQSVIDPQCETEQGIYVDPYGNIFPCCWIGGDYLEQPVEENLPIHKLRNIAVQRSKEMLEDIGIPNCNDGVLHTQNVLWQKIEDHWQGENKCLTCARQCSSAIYDGGKK